MENNQTENHIPLAYRMRPKTFKDFFGQADIIGPNSYLRKLIENDKLPSMVFWGPPGSGKTTLAQIIANTTNSRFISISAVSSGVKDLKNIVEQARKQLDFNKQKTILFIDEIHRFNKAQQDFLLPYVENGTVVLIGATTENPSFEIISALLSRSKVFILNSLTEDELSKILRKALKDKNQGLGKLNLQIDKKAIEYLINFANGDARILLNNLEQTADFVKSLSRVSPSGKKLKKITKEIVEQVLNKMVLRYDKKGEEHYNLISAFIKSMRGSDIDASLYWLSRMIEAGEDPEFIARRMMIFSSEDIGNADPLALVIANSAFDAVRYIGFPEAQINLAQVVVYLAAAPKSNASYSALMKAKADVGKYGNLPVPLHLRNAVTDLMKDIGYGKDYKYPHSFGGYVKEKYLPDKITGSYFKPNEVGFEKKIKERIEERKK